MSTLEKTDSLSGDTPQGEERESNGNVPTFEKKVTDSPQEPSTPSAARVSPVTTGEVTGGNSGVTGGNSASAHALDREREPALHRLQPPSGLEAIWAEIVWDAGTLEEK